MHTLGFHGGYPLGHGLTIAGDDVLRLGLARFGDTRAGGRVSMG